MDLRGASLWAVQWMPSCAPEWDSRTVMAPGCQCLQGEHPEVASGERGARKLSGICNGAAQLNFIACVFGRHLMEKGAFNVTLKEWDPVSPSNSKRSPGRAQRPANSQSKCVPGEM